MKDTDDVARIVFDATRLFARRNAAHATGIDRVDVQIAHRLLLDSSFDVTFGINRNDRLHIMIDSVANTLIKKLQSNWIGSCVEFSDQELRDFNFIEDVSESAIDLIEALEKKEFFHDPTQRIYLNLSHSNIASRTFVEDVVMHHASQLVIYIHDLIPITHPEYVRLGDDEVHMRRLDNIIEFDPKFIVNSKNTAKEISDYYGKVGKTPQEVTVSYIGVESRFVESKNSLSEPLCNSVRPYFVMLGTIEPRKNHMSILLIWKALVSELGEGAPVLKIIGARGWNTDHVYQFLDQCSILHDFVEELNDCRDEEVLEILRNSRALLFPTFAEGWGMPLVEAISAGVPVICSDISALRESGAGIVEYIDPLDLPRWKSTIIDYTSIESVKRSEQIDRLAEYSPPDWESGYKVVREFLLSTAAEGKPFSPIGDIGLDFQKAVKFLEVGVPKGEDAWIYRVAISEKTLRNNWYDIQIDSANRKYIWCGAHDRSSIMISNSLHGAKFIFLSVRSLVENYFDSKDAITIFVNGRYADFQCLGSGKNRRIGISVNPNDRKHLVEFVLLDRYVPYDVGVGTDKRYLAFNIYEIEIVGSSRVGTH